MPQVPPQEYVDASEYNETGTPQAAKHLVTPADALTDEQATEIFRRHRRMLPRDPTPEMIKAGTDEIAVRSVTWTVAGLWRVMYDTWTASQAVPADTGE